MLGISVISISDGLVPPPLSCALSTSNSLPSSCRHQPESLSFLSTLLIPRQIRLSREQAALDRELGSDTKILGDFGQVPCFYWLLRSLSVLRDGNSAPCGLSTER